MTTYLRVSLFTSIQLSSFLFILIISLHLLVLRNFLLCLLYISLSISSSFSPSLPSSTSFSTLLPLQFFCSPLTSRSFCPSPGSVFALRCCPSPPFHCLHFLRGLLSSMRMLCVALWHACLDAATSCSTCPPPSLSLSVSVCVVCANESVHA